MTTIAGCAVVDVRWVVSDTTTWTAAEDAVVGITPLNLACHWITN
jgi:hypothetical protein